MRVNPNFGRKMCCCCKPWWLLIFVLAFIAFLFSFNTTTKVLNYFSLNASVPATSVELRVWEIKPLKFVVSAKYFFQVDGKLYYNETTFKKRFANSLTANDFLNKLKTKTNLVWFNSSQIHQSTLEKSFPLKGIIYSLVLIFLFIYFFILKLYIPSKNGCDIS